MARPPAEGLTPRETAIMQILWGSGGSTVEGVRVLESIARTPRLFGRCYESSSIKDAFASVTTRVLTLYLPAVPQSKERRRAVRGLLKRFFSGSSEDLVVHLLEEESLTPERLAALRRRFLQASDPREAKGGE